MKGAYIKEGYHYMDTTGKINYIPKDLANPHPDRYFNEVGAIKYWYVVDYRDWNKMIIEASKLREQLKNEQREM